MTAVTEAPPGAPRRDRTKLGQACRMLARVRELEGALAETRELLYWQVYHLNGRDKVRFERFRDGEGES